MKIKIKMQIVIKEMIVLLRTLAFSLRLEYIYISVSSTSLRLTKTDLPKRSQLARPMIDKRPASIHQLTQTSPLAIRRISGAIGAKRKCPLFPK
jgi:hypothetical protein